MYKKILLFLLCLSSVLPAKSVNLSFQNFANDESKVASELVPVEGERVDIRGFLYRENEGGWILANEPDLRGCCVGSHSKRLSQFSVELLEEPEQQGIIAREIIGTLVLERENGVVTKLRLAQARLCTSDSTHSSYYLLLVLLGTPLTGALTYLLYLRKRTLPDQT